MDWNQISKVFYYSTTDCIELKFSGYVPFDTLILHCVSPAIRTVEFYLFLSMKLASFNISNWRYCKKGDRMCNYRDYINYLEALHLVITSYTHTNNKRWIKSWYKICNYRDYINYWEVLHLVITSYTHHTNS